MSTRPSDYYTKRGSAIAGGGIATARRGGPDSYGPTPVVLCTAVGAQVARTFTPEQPMRRSIVVEDAGRPAPGARPRKVTPSTAAVILAAAGLQPAATVDLRGAHARGGGAACHPASSQAAQGQVKALGRYGATAATSFIATATPGVSARRPRPGSAPGGVIIAPGEGRAQTKDSARRGGASSGARATPAPDQGPPMPGLVAPVAGVGAPTPRVGAPVAD